MRSFWFFSGLFLGVLSMRTLILCGLLMMPPAAVEPAAAATPRAVINGPTTGTAGEILILDASQSTGDDVRFLWKVAPELPGRLMFAEVCNNPAKIQICSIPGVYRYTLVVSNSDGADLIFWDVKIPGTPPPNPTPPGPDPVPPGPEPGPPEPSPPNPAPPTPEPDPPKPPPTPGPLPAGRFDVAKDAKQFAEAVNSPNVKAEAAAVADAWESVRAQIAAGALVKPSAILAALQAATVAALGDGLEPWKTFGTSLGGRIAAIYGSGKLSSPDDWRTLIGELVLGLRAVK